MHLARVHSATDEVTVELPDGVATVRLATTMTKEQIAKVAEEGHLAVLIVEDGPTTMPVLIGMAPPPKEAKLDREASKRVVQADVDGRRVQIEAQDEIVFRCGKASVTLRRNGRVVIKGTYLETHSQGTNRVKGAQVRVN